MTPVGPACRFLGPCKCRPRACRAAAALPRPAALCVCGIRLRSVGRNQTAGVCWGAVFLSPSSHGCGDCNGSVACPNHVLVWLRVATPAKIRMPMSALQRHAHAARACGRPARRSCTVTVQPGRGRRGGARARRAVPRRHAARLVAQRVAGLAAGAAARRRRAGAGPAAAQRRA